MTRDRYSKLGPKKPLDQPEDALQRVREFWPTAYQEGSTGPERTWWVRSDAGNMVVAHHWQTDRGNWFIRIAKNLNTVIFDD